MEGHDQINQDVFPISNIHHIEMYVGNALQTAYYYCNAFGFKIIAYKGLESGCRDRVSYVLKQGEIILVVTGSLNSSNEIAEHVKVHGDGVKDIALRVNNVEEKYEGALKRGGNSHKRTWRELDEQGVVRCASIGTYGDTVHTLIDDSSYRGIYAPGYIPYNGDPHQHGMECGLLSIDHIVGNVEKMDQWTDYYEKVFGFHLLKQFDDQDISTEYSALMSKVMSSDSEIIKFPINEPAMGKKRSQIQEFLDYYQGPGVQHIAFLTRDIVATIKELKRRGVEFLYTPPTYYQKLEERVGIIDEKREKIEELGILVDRDEEGYLLQIFTKPLVDRPTLFFEIIQRKGARGFGNGNFKALFESIEREQERRGNL